MGSNVECALLKPDNAILSMGLIVADTFPSPFPHCDVVTTSMHKTWRGSRGGGVIPCMAGLAKQIDRAVFPGMQGAPEMGMIAARAVPAKEFLSPEFKAYAQKACDNTKAMAEELAAAQPLFDEEKWLAK